MKSYPIKEFHYRTSGNGFCEDKCKYKYKKSNTRIGSLTCQHCEFCRGHNKEKQILYCDGRNRK